MNLSLDLGGHSARLICDTLTSSWNIFKVELPENLQYEGMTLDSSEFHEPYQQIFTELLEEQEVRIFLAAQEPRGLRLSLSGDMLFSKLMPVHEQGKEGMESSFLDFQKSLPKNSKDWVISWQSVFKDSPQKKVLWSAFYAPWMESLQKILTRYQLPIVAVEPSFLSLKRALLEVYPEAKLDQEHVIIDMGHKHTQIVIVAWGKVRYYRSFGLAGESFTRAFEAATKVDRLTAINHKLDYDWDEQDYAIESFIEQWLKEIEASLLQYCKDYEKEANFKDLFERIWLVGRACYWKGMSSRVQSYVGVPTYTACQKNVEVIKDLSKEQLGAWQQVIGLHLGWTV